MSGAGAYQELAYEVPAGPLCLEGPLAKPAPGTLPLRGDLAHIALAGRYLSAHYAVPQLHVVQTGGAQLLLAPQDDAAIVDTLAEGAVFEALDFVGAWCWGACGPEGPSGYVETERLRLATA